MFFLKLFKYKLLFTSTSKKRTRAICFALRLAASLPSSGGRISSLPNKSSRQKYISFLVSVFFLQDLTKRVDGANVQCITKFTNFDEGAYKALVYLDRQNVACPKDYFLASFQLNRQNDRKSSKIRYSYQCCKFVL